MVVVETDEDFGLPGESMASGSGVPDGGRSMIGGRGCVEIMSEERRPTRIQTTQGRFQERAFVSGRQVTLKRTGNRGANVLGWVARYAAVRRSEYSRSGLSLSRTDFD
jgi:hypothetical protein